jgi:DNA replication protein DnaC
MALLILDDWGPDRLTANQRRDLVEIVEDRYGRSSTLITSQLPTDTWHEVIGEPTFAARLTIRHAIGRPGSIAFKPCLRLQAFASAPFGQGA